MSKSKGSSNQKQLFKTKIVPGKAGSGKLFEEEFVVDEGPVECLGMTFENDEKRREYFLEKLHEKLKDPEFRKIEGFQEAKKYARKNKLNIWGDPELTKKYLRLTSKWGKHKNN